MSKNNNQENNEIMTIEEASFSDLLETNLDRFLEELSALNDTLPIQIVMLSIKHKELIKKLERISTTSEEIDEDGNEIVRYKVTEDEIDEFPKIHKHLNRADIAKKIIPRNFIVSIISQYDAFLGELVRIIYDINPNLIRSSEKELNPSDLFNFDSIEDLKLHIVDKEVDSLLREEHLEQLKVLEKRISKVTKNEFYLTKGLPVLKDFVELTQRRNLFVHTNGIVTRQYLDINNKWKFKDCKSSLNDELRAEPGYCENSYRVLFEMAVKLTHVLWRKFLPEDRTRADEHLNQIIYDLLVDSEYSLAVTISDFCTNTIKKFSSEQLRKFIVINKAIAYKLLDKKDECNNIIDNEDWSIGNEFKLAKLVLLDEFEKAKQLMIKIGADDELLNKGAYENWPLFKVFRKTKEFKSAYFELFNQEFSLEEIQNKEKVEHEKEVNLDLDDVE
ncbi:hypothetical protein [Psychroflexus aestuariivivens]|uniref:hypothetical protein n=1 Tax=Psychroflexus aestuariivivens TaxID=1795040 RepID=UPI000FDB5AC8|nr:hypothetical protein [Psychroflexus aestuariivivens]